MALIRMRSPTSSARNTVLFRHRPHYHLLLFVRKKVDPLKLSALISRCWKCGRTDGIPYQSNFYVFQHNVVKNNHLGDIIACAKYVQIRVEKVRLQTPSLYLIDRSHSRAC